MQKLGIEEALGNPRARHRLDEHLDDVAEVLRIDDRRRAAAERAAQELTEWVQADRKLSRFAPDLYPQGSFLIRTTVRPRGKGSGSDEFDLDMVIELAAGWDGSPDELFELVWERLSAHPLYGRYAERRNRCVCINFPGEFHMDVLPARPDRDRRDDGHATAIEVPDRRRHDWKESDPKGFAAWFEGRSRLRVEESLRLAGKSILPEDDAAGLDVLRRSVQLTKRHRDVRFNGSDDAPRSIVLTTLLGEHYAGMQSTYAALRISVARIKGWADSCRGVPAVENPVNEEENFAEAWDDERFRAFKDFIDGFNTALVELDNAHGPIEIGKLLSMLFDEDISVAAMKRYGERKERERESGSMYFEPKNKGQVGFAPAAAAIPAIKPVPGGTNFGG